MSPLALLGATATLLSTLTLLPHLLQAVRTRRPSGSAFGWALGTASSVLWFAYGVIAGDLVVAAPGVVTIPAGSALAIWCWARMRRDPARERALV